MESRPSSGSEGRRRPWAWPIRVLQSWTAFGVAALILAWVGWLEQPLWLYVTIGLWLFVALPLYDAFAPTGRGWTGRSARRRAVARWYLAWTSLALLAVLVLEIRLHGCAEPDGFGDYCATLWFGMQALVVLVWLIGGGLLGLARLLPIGAGATFGASLQAGLAHVAIGPLEHPTQPAPRVRPIRFGPGRWVVDEVEGVPGAASGMTIAVCSARTHWQYVEPSRGQLAASRRKDTTVVRDETTVVVSDPSIGLRLRLRPLSSERAAPRRDQPGTVALVIALVAGATALRLWLQAS
jgi:hypothetical protein